METLKHEEKRRDEWVAAYRSAIKINPNLPAAYENLGEMLAEAVANKSEPISLNDKAAGSLRSI